MNIGFRIEHFAEVAMGCIIALCTDLRCQIARGLAGLFARYSSTKRLSDVDREVEHTESM